MLMRFGALLMGQGPLNEMRGFANDMRRTEGRGIANHAQEPIPGLGHTIVGHAQGYKLAILFGCKGGLRDYIELEQYDNIRSSKHTILELGKCRTIAKLQKAGS